MEGKTFPGFGVLVPHPPSKPPDPRPPALSHRCKHPPVRKCSVNQQRGIYSDIITPFKFQVKALIQIRTLKSLTDILLYIHTKYWASVMLWHKPRVTVYWLVLHSGTWDPAKVTGPIHPRGQWCQPNKRWDTVQHDTFRHVGILRLYFWFTNHAFIRRAHCAPLKYNILYAVCKTFDLSALFSQIQPSRLHLTGVNLLKRITQDSTHSNHKLLTSAGVEIHPRSRFPTKPFPARSLVN